MDVAILDPDMTSLPTFSRAPCLITLAPLLAALALGGCTMVPNLDASSYPRKAMNASPVGQDAAVLLDGVDPVAYQTVRLQAYGQLQFQSLHGGVSVRFTSAAHKALFDADPQKYLPAYGGLCANGMVYGIPRLGDPAMWRVIDGKLHLFEDRAARDAFLLDTARHRQLADTYWQKEAAGRNAYAQWLLRKTFRVPHYQSDRQLATRVEAARAAQAEQAVRR
jgi:YHS domain-containing protein